jgi:hypothetical protein
MKSPGGQFICHRTIEGRSSPCRITVGDREMRLPIIPPANLNSEQKPLYDDMREGIAKNFQGFINIRDDGALLGPWNPWIHKPQFGKPAGS